ncbi:hypothetical protein E2562_012114 [Oryza meyeriana var. granulata]|uniref:Uncharacterized protein n=1 Tax=Oryza meyeriana var. granulata TaxID=110450 RepID=A0A6G1F778_9ORYZ|nr:hypothetical protein E2562_012114 [Oryza meyeriana var. granulata]
MVPVWRKGKRNLRRPTAGGAAASRDRGVGPSAACGRRPVGLQPGVGATARLGGYTPCRKGQQRRANAGPQRCATGEWRRRKPATASGSAAGRTSGLGRTTGHGS